ncbi:MAG: aspartate kinase [Firmicutes bacterium]|nr:aspartate kinase [Bacillota bacterium]
MIKVAKFGGSSLASAEQFEKAGAIVKADASRRYVVPSAPGKRDKSDFKVTDMLYECYNSVMEGRDLSVPFGKIIERYSGIVEGLGLKLSLKDEFDSIRSAMLHRAGRDYVASRGEYLNAKILAEYLEFDFIDASEVIFFSDNGNFDSDKTNEILSAVLRRHKTAVIPGFYGSMPNGTIKTFSRGGSDITGSIVARAAQADLYENWTDVDGFLMADPRIVPDPKRIDTITYRELRELSYMGATVLHEDAIFPVRFAGIPINIRNTNAPESNGTMIVSHAPSDNTGAITGIAGHKGFSVITIEKDMMNAELGFGRRVLEVLEKHGISFEHLPSGIDTMSVIVSTVSLSENRDRIINDICAAVDPESVSVEDGIALIAVVGRNMVKAKGTAAKVFNAITRVGTNIRMIDQGSCEFNIIIGVEEHDFERSMRAIYEEFMPD